MVPPSINQKSGEPIEWESEGDPADCRWKWIISDGWHRSCGCQLIARNWPQGSRHFATLALAGMLLRSGWSEESVEQFVLAVCTAANDEELSSRLQGVRSTAKRLEDDQTATGTPTLEEIFDKAIVAKVREWLELRSHVDADASSVDHHHTDLGNARRLVALYGHNLRYCSKWKQWLVWDNSRWVPDDTGEVQRLAKATIEFIHSEAGSMANGAAIELRRHALRSESEARLRAMVELAKTEPGIPVTPEELDADPWLLNCLNGTLNLRTGELLSSHREHLCTKQVPVDFDPQATCPVWEAFLNRIMKGRAELIRFLQRGIGYSLTGMTNEQVLFLFYGTGANGKSTFIETVRHLLGDYAQQADFSTFLERKGDSPRNDLASLKGARFVAAVEAAEGRQIAESVIKQATGGDTIRARFLFKEFFEYKPQFKLFLVANHKPKVTGTDEAIWRRIRLAPFEVTIPAGERDKELPDKLRRELPGIMAWAVRGCLDWQANGLGEPVEVSTATAAYRQEMDMLAEFLNDKCIQGQTASTSAGLFTRLCRYGLLRTVSNP